jgi:hypothetical protein
VILTVPQDTALSPTLGPQVCDFIERNLVFGPGDLRGQPAILDDEKRALIYRFYEVHPQGHPQAGRRRFKRCSVSLPKGTAKTELAAWIAACELHAEGPVRYVGWTKGGDPIGGPVTDPYIPMVAYTEEQSDELAYTALRVILEEGPLRHDFDIGLDRILRLKGDGIAQSLSGSPNARDGARTTFQHMDDQPKLEPCGMPLFRPVHQQETPIPEPGRSDRSDPALSPPVIDRDKERDVLGQLERALEKRPKPAPWWVGNDPVNRLVPSLESTVLHVDPAHIAIGPHRLHEGTVATGGFQQPTPVSAWDVVKLVAQALFLLGLLFGAFILSSMWGQ